MNEAVHDIPVPDAEDGNIHRGIRGNGAAPRQLPGDHPRLQITDIEGAAAEPSRVEQQPAKTRKVMDVARDGGDRAAVGGEGFDGTDLKGVMDRELGAVPQLQIGAGLIGMGGDHAERFTLRKPERSVDLRQKDLALAIQRTDLRRLGKPLPHPHTLFRPIFPFIPHHFIPASSLSLPSARNLSSLYLILEKYPSTFPEGKIIRHTIDFLIYYLIIDTVYYSNTHIQAVILHSFFIWLTVILNFKAITCCKKPIDRQNHT